MSKSKKGTPGKAETPAKNESEEPAGDLLSYSGMMRMALQQRKEKVRKLREELAEKQKAAEDGTGIKK